MADSPQDVFDHPITAVIENDGERDGYGWIDFEWYGQIEAEPEALKSAVKDYIMGESRNIEVFSVMDEAGKVVFTEESFEPEDFDN